MQHLTNILTSRHSSICRYKTNGHFHSGRVGSTWYVTFETSYDDQLTPVAKLRDQISASFSPLLKLLQDQDPKIRTAAVSTLEKFATYGIV
jgi:hypothetical protein